MKPEPFAARAQSLEEGYFRSKEADMVAKLRQVFEAKRDKDELRKAGVNNEEVLDRLVKISVRGEMLTVFKLYPLVEITWADGKVAKAEVDAVISAAIKLGIPAESDMIQRLREWLDRGPTEDGRAAWRMFAAELRTTLNPKELATFRDDMLKYAQSVAEASGGLFGVLAQVSAEEKKVIEVIRKALTPE